MHGLYQELIMDHGRRPRNFGPLTEATHVKEGFNPLCGDKVTVYLSESNGVVDEARFEGCGCVISMASASLMTQRIKNKTIAEIEALFDHFHAVVTGDSTHLDELDKLAAFSGVSAYPARVKCATLCWHTLRSIFAEDNAS